MMFPSSAGWLERAYRAYGWSRSAIPCVGNQRDVALAALVEAIGATNDTAVATILAQYLADAIASGARTIPTADDPEGG